MVELTDKSAVSEENQIHVPEDKLKEEQKKEFEELVEKFKCECLKSYSVNRSDDRRSWPSCGTSLHQKCNSHGQQSTQRGGQDFC